MNNSESLLECQAQQSLNQILDIHISTGSENTQELSFRRYCNGIMGVPITFIGQYTPEQFMIIGHEHDLCGNGGTGLKTGQFEVNHIGKYKRILVKKLISTN